MSPAQVLYCFSSLPVEKKKKKKSLTEEKQDKYPWQILRDKDIKTYPTLFSSSLCQLYNESVHSLSLPVLEHHRGTMTHA